MGAEMRPYVVRQGDYLTKLAFVHGFDVEEVWNDPKNGEIRGLRKDHNILAPGDVVYLPVKEKEGLPIQKGVTNRYVAKVPKVPVKVRFRSGSERLANAKFTIEGEATPNTGTTDGDAQLELSVPAYVSEVCVVFPDLNERYKLLVGHLDPEVERSGVRARLVHLGYMLPSAREFFGYDVGNYGEDDDAAQVAAAVRAFQRDNNLPITGVVDTDTQAALAAAHGS
ncbi:MAG: peptidoglycan-binding domain-containing protein [Minicystis sp.]